MRKQTIVNLFLASVVSIGFYACTSADILKADNEAAYSSSQAYRKVKDLVDNVGDKNSVTNNTSAFYGVPYRVVNKAPYTHFDRTALIYTYFGLSIKGSGGGGSFIDGIDILNRIDELNVYDVSTVSDDKLYIVAGGIGAPTALKNNIDALINSIKSSVATLANIKGKKIGGVLSVESGSANSVIAMLLSKELNVPLIDADGAGRSVPKLSNLSYAHENYSIAPTVLTSVANPGVAIDVLEPKDADDAEQLIRATISKPGFGEIGGLAIWAQTGKELKASSVIRNTFSDAHELGRYTLLAMYEGVDYLDDYFKLKEQFIASYKGTLSNFTVETKGGFDITKLTVTLDNGKTIVINALNENLLMSSSNGTNAIITAPHLISYMVEGDVKGQYIPLNNGDDSLMKASIGKRIYIVGTYSNRRLYDYDSTFLNILKTVFDYQGPVTPPSPY